MFLFAGAGAEREGRPHLLTAAARRASFHGPPSLRGGPSLTSSLPAGRRRASQCSIEAACGVAKWRPNQWSRTLGRGRAAEGGWRRLFSDLALGVVQHENLNNAPSSSLSTRPGTLYTL